MELRHLRYFVRAAELLHFTRAAESLFISQPSLSIHIQQLEDELKTKLFARVGRSVLLTESGQVLLTHARRAFEELDLANQKIDSMTGLLRGTLTLGTIPLFGSMILPPWIDQFCQIHPNVHVNVRAGRSEDVEAGLLAGTMDVGFSLGPPDHPELQSQQLLTDEIVVAAAKEHPLAKKAKLSVADLASASMALPSHKISSTRLIGAYFEKLGIAPKISVEQDDGHALLELVKLGGFITCLPKLVIRQDPDLVILALPPPGVPIRFVSLWTQLSPAATAFLALKSAKDFDKA